MLIFAVPTGAVAWLVHQFTRTPYVLTAHLGDVPGGVPEQTEQLFKKIKWLTIPIWKGAAKVTAVSSFVAELARKAYGIEPKIILNGVRLPKQAPRKDNNVPILLFVGRLSIQKNPLLAIQALALLRELPWTLKIIGDGPLSTAAREEVKKLNLQDRIFFSGWLSAEQVKVAMEQSDLLLIPSLSEGLPMVGVEALGYGLAIVGSRIGGLQDIIIEGKNGVFFELSEGASAMAKGLRSFLENHELLTTAQLASLNHAAAFEWSHSIDLYEKILLMVRPSFH